MFKRASILVVASLVYLFMAGCTENSIGPNSDQSLNQESDFTPNALTRGVVSQRASEITVSATGAVAIVGTGLSGNNYIYKYDGITYNKTADMCVAVEYGPAGQCWLITATGRIMEKVGSSWVLRDGTNNKRASAITVGLNNQAYIIESGTSAIYKWSSGAWVQLGGAAVKIEAGADPEGSLWCVNNTGQIWQLVSGSGWVDRSAGILARDITVGAQGQVFVVQYVLGSWPGPMYKWNNGAWISLGGLASKIEAGPDCIVWCVNSEGKIFKSNTNGGYWFEVPGDFITDIDGNKYSTVTIGTQTWTVQNLKTTKLNDGTPLNLVTDKDLWCENGDKANYCWHSNNAANKSIYGALYNWTAVNTGKLAPTGWRVPSQTDFYTLMMYLGGINNAGGKLKEAGVAHWRSPNVDATNMTGFTGLPGGNRYGAQTDAPGQFGNFTVWSFFWTTTPQDPDISPYDAFCYKLYSEYGSIEFAYEDKISGYSVRLIKNN